MTNKLWKELDDVAAEKVCGGEGIGQDIKAAQVDIRENIGAQNPNKFVRELGLKNFGGSISVFAQAVNGPA
jgi:hypothetical protein